MLVCYVASTDGVESTCVASVAVIYALRWKGHTVQVFYHGPCLPQHYEAVEAASGRRLVQLDSWLQPRRALSMVFADSANGCDTAVIMAEEGLGDATSKWTGAALCHGVPCVVAAAPSTKAVTLELAASQLPASCERYLLELQHHDASPSRGSGSGTSPSRAAAAALQSLKARASIGSVSESLQAANWLATLSDPGASFQVKERLLDRVSRGVDASTLQSVLQEPSTGCLVRSRNASASDLAGLEGSCAIRVAVAAGGAPAHSAHNLALLERLGCELITVSLDSATCLPPDVSMLYIARALDPQAAADLSANYSMRLSVAEFAACGGVVYAEGDSLAYLSKTVAIGHDLLHMAGVLPLHTVLHAEPQAVGHVALQTSGADQLFPEGIELRGFVDTALELRHEVRATSLSSACHPCPPGNSSNDGAAMVSAFRAKVVHPGAASAENFDRCNSERFLGLSRTCSPRATALEIQGLDSKWSAHSAGGADAVAVQPRYSGDSGSGEESPFLLKADINDPEAVPEGFSVHCALGTLVHVSFASAPAALAGLVQAAATPRPLAAARESSKVSASKLSTSPSSLTPQYLARVRQGSTSLSTASRNMGSEFASMSPSSSHMMLTARGSSQRTSDSRGGSCALGASGTVGAAGSQAQQAKAYGSGDVDGQRGSAGQQQLRLRPSEASSSGDACTARNADSCTPSGSCSNLARNCTSFDACVGSLWSSGGPVKAGFPPPRHSSSHCLSALPPHGARDSVASGASTLCRGTVSAHESGLPSASTLAAALPRPLSTDARHRSTPSSCLDLPSLDQGARALPSFAVVSCSPAITDIVNSFGESRRVLGVTSACDKRGAASVMLRTLDAVSRSSWADAAARVAGQCDDWQPLHSFTDDALRSLNGATVLMWEPPVAATRQCCVLPAHEPCHTELEQAAATAGASVYTLRVPRSLSDMYDTIHMVGGLLRAESAASELTTALRTRLRELARTAAPRGPRRKVLALRSLQPYRVAGGWLPELISLAGGEPLETLPGENASTLHWNDVLDLAPDVLILMPELVDLPSARASVNLLAEESGWWSLPATRARDVYMVDGACLMAAGPRVLEALTLLITMISSEPAGKLLSHDATQAGAMRSGAQSDAVKCYKMQMEAGQRCRPTWLASFFLPFA